MMKLKKCLFVFALSLSFGKCAFACDIPQFDIVIVGAGLSGLNAAREIHKANTSIKIAIIEAQDKPGGRTSTLTMPDGSLVELGGELIDRDQKFIQGVLEELGLELEPIKLNGEIFGIHNGEKLDLDSLKIYVDDILVKLKEVQSKVNDSDKTRLDTETKHPVSTSFCSVINLNDFENAVLQGLIRDEEGIDLDKLKLGDLPSMIEFLEDYQKLLFLKTTPVIRQLTSIVLSLYDYQYRIKGGTKALIEGLIARLPSDSIYFNTCLSNLSQRDGLYNLQMTDGRRFIAETVILSTPFSVLRSEYKILDDESLGISPNVRKIIDTMVYGTNSKIIMPVQGLVPVSYIINTTSGGLTAWQNPAGITWMLGGELGANITEDSKLVDELSKQMSFVLDAKLGTGSKPIVINWNQNPFSRGSYRAFIAETHDLAGYSPSKVLTGLCDFAMMSDKLFAIGEHTCSGEVDIEANNNSPIPPGFMQSALYAGYVVAKLVNSNYKCIISPHTVAKL